MANAVGFACITLSRPSPSCFLALEASDSNQQGTKLHDIVFSGCNGNVMSLAGIGSKRTERRKHSTFAANALPDATGVDWVKSTDDEFFQSDNRPIMLFDGVCNLCSGGVRFVRDNDRNKRIRYEPLQSESGKKLLIRSGRFPDDISSVVLVDKDRSYIKSEAVLRIMEYMDLPFPQFALFLKSVPLFIRDFAYDHVANNRYAVFGRSDSESCQI